MNTHFLFISLKNSLKFFILFVPSFFCFLHGNSKIIGLVPVRNEATIIAQCLKALALHTDAIIVLDDASEDDTVSMVESLAQQCHIAKIICKKTWIRDEPGDRNALLKAGREIGGTHFIVIDADEILTANCLSNNILKKRILELKPGDKLCITWIQLWRSVDQYRHDKSCWSNQQGDFIFCDSGTAFYSSDFIHTSRSPNNNMPGKVYSFDTTYTYGLMHFQFVNWNNLLVKQAWYRCLERIRDPKKSISTINEIYKDSKNETGIVLKRSHADWFEGYYFFDKSRYLMGESWQKKQVVQWFAHYGKDFFKGLDIWDIDWR